MTVRKYSSISQETSLTSALNSTATTMVVNSAAVLGNITPAAGERFTLVIDPDTALEEIVYATSPSSPSSTTITIIRGVDGTGTEGVSGVAHSAGAKVRHMAIGVDFREANNHIKASLAGHAATTSAELRGVISDETGTGALVFGTSPTIATPTITSPTITGTGAIAGTFTGNLTGNVTGNASTATTLATSRDFQILGDVEASAISFNGSGNVSLTTQIATGAIVNADVNTSAQIAYGKLALTNGIVNADINASAAIDWSKIAPSSTVSTTELGYLDGVTSAIQTQLDSKLATSTAASTYAPLASPALTGVPTAPTAAANTNTTQVATTAYVQTEINDLIASAPGALDTLNELAAALGNDASFSTTVTNSLAGKLSLTGGTMSGAIAMGTNKITGLGDPTSAQDAATKNYIDNTVLAPSNLTGVITSVGNLTSIASQTGTGSKFVVDNTPTLITPVLGVATATSINGTTIPTSKTLVATDSTQYVVPSQSGNAGKYLTTDGTTSSWGTIDTSAYADAVMSVMGAY